MHQQTYTICIDAFGYKHDKDIVRRFPQDGTTLMLRGDALVVQLWASPELRPVILTAWMDSPETGTLNVLKTGRRMQVHMGCPASELFVASDDGDKRYVAWTCVVEGTQFRSEPSNRAFSAAVHRVANKRPPWPYGYAHEHVTMLHVRVTFADNPWTPRYLPDGRWGHSEVAHHVDRFDGDGDAGDGYAFIGANDSRDAETCKRVSECRSMSRDDIKCRRANKRTGGDEGTGGERTGGERTDTDDAIVEITSRDGWTFAVPKDMMPHFGGERSRQMTVGGAEVAAVLWHMRTQVPVQSAHVALNIWKAAIELGATRLQRELAIFCGFTKKM